MKRLVFFIVLFFAAAAPVFALDLNAINPLHWLNEGVQGVLNAVVGAGFVALIAWLGKGKWDATVLKGTVAGIKEEIDMFREASGQASPGGTKIVAEEWGPIAGKTLTNILNTLRGINPNWIPHI